MLLHVARTISGKLRHALFLCPALQALAPKASTKERGVPVSDASVVLASCLFLCYLVCYAAHVDRMELWAAVSTPWRRGMEVADLSQLLFFINTVGKPRREYTRLYFSFFSKTPVYKSASHLQRPPQPPPWLLPCTGASPYLFIGF